MGPAIEIEIAQKGFAAGEPLFNDFALSVAPGEVLALVGPSGVGKSSLLRLVGGADAAFSGRVTIDGVAAARAPVPGFLFQDARLLPWFDAVDNLRAVRPETSPEAAAAMLRRVGLAGYEAAFPHQLSGGMQRRVAIARALSVNAGLMLLDEPFVSLDRALVKDMGTVLADLFAADQPTALLVTHTAEDAALLAHRAVVLEGRPAAIVADLRFQTPPAQRGAAERAEIAARLAALGGG